MIVRFQLPKSIYFDPKNLNYQRTFLILIILTIQHSLVNGQSILPGEADSDSIRLAEYKELSQPILEEYWEADQIGPFQTTIPWLIKLGSLARRLNLPEKECKAYGNIALSYQYIGMTDSAFYWANKAISMRQFISDKNDPEVVKAMLILAKLHVVGEQPTVGTEWCRVVLNITKDSFQLSEVYSLLGSCQGQIGNYQKQLILNDSAFIYAPRKRTLKNRNHKGYLLFMRSKAFWELRDLEQQLDLLYDALRTYSSIPELYREQDKIADIHNDLAITWGLKGKWHKERQELLRGIYLVDTGLVTDKSVQATLFYNLGLSYGREPPPNRSTIENFDSSSTYYPVLHNLDSAKYFLTQALAIWKQHPNSNKSQIAKTYSNLSLLAGREDSLQQQLKFANEGLDLMREVHGDHHPQVALLWTRRASSHEKQGQLRQALRDLQSAIRACQNPEAQTDPIGNPIADSVVHKIRMVSILQRKAEYLAQLAETEENTLWLKFAFQTNERAVELVNLIREDQSSSIRTGTRGIDEPYDQMFLALPVYEQGLDLAWQLYEATGEEAYFQKAFVISEWSKTVFLTGGLSERNMREVVGIPDSLIRVEMVVAGKIRGHEGRLRKLGKKIKPLRDTMLELKSTIEDSLKDHVELYILQEEYHHLELQIADPIQDSLKTQAELFLLRENLRHLKQQIAEDYPELKALKGTIELPSLEGIRAHYTAHSQSALLEYFYGESHIYLLGVSSENLYFNRIAQTEKLDATIDTVLTCLKSESDAINGAPAAAFLAKTLVLDPLKELEIPKGGQLLIIPDGKLCRLSFGALVQEEDCRLNADCRFLVEDFELSYKYSLQPALNFKTGRRRYSKQRTYLGYLNKDNGYDSLEEFQKSMEDGEEGFGGLVIEGKNTSQEELTTFLEQYPLPTILYFISHGISSANPWDACLELGMSISSAGDTTKEQLSVYEMMSLQLPVELLVLPACFSADNQDRGGQGPISLASASQFAGAKSLLTSLWDTNVSGANGMISDFLGGIANDQSRSHALAQAQRTYLSSLQNRHPYYWANLILIGDSSPLPKQANPLTIWLTLAGFLLFILALSVFYFIENQPS